MKKLFSIILAVLMVAGAAVFTVNAESPFPDVVEGKWYYDAVMEAYELGIMLGNDDGTFKPLDTMTRAQMVTLITRLAGADLTTYDALPKFKDVKPSNWFAKAVGWANEKGLVGGYEDNTFKPNNNITRQELAKLFVGLIDYLDAYVPDAEDAISRFNDTVDIAKWARDYVNALRATGLVKGDAAGNFNPKSTATRAEVSTIAVRLNPFLSGDQGVDLMLEKFASGVCSAHNHYHVTMGRSADFTVENFEKSIAAWMKLDTAKYEVEVDPDGVEEGLEGYSGEGFGCSYTAVLEVTLKDIESGESATKEIEFYCMKFDVVGGMLTCPDDHVQEAVLEDLDTYFELDDDGRIKIPFGGGATFTRENLSEKILTAVGLDPRIYQIVVSEDSTNTFDEVKSLHSGICHGQIHDAEFDICIRDLPGVEFYGGADVEGALDKASTEYVTWRFWFSKDCTEVYDSQLPTEAVIPFSGDLTKENLDAVIHTYITDISSMNGDYVEYRYDFDALKSALSGSSSAQVDITFFQPVAAFTFGNQAGLPDLSLSRTYTIQIAD